MKILKVKWLDHPILNNLELDFTDGNGVPFNTILFAGENGSGKTTILESLSTFLNKGSFKYFEYIDYIAEGRILKAISVSDTQNDAHYDIIEGETTIQMRTGNGTGNTTIDNNPINIRFGGSILSKARADFKTNKIKSTTTSQLDESKYDVDIKDDFTSQKQLIVDLENQDNATFAQQNRQEGAHLAWEAFYPNSKIYRFKNAFDTFFDNLTYDQVEDSGNEKTILFIKNGNKIPIDMLSTGEKQIVFRGTYLLKNSGQLGSATIFIDEPELSMHPKWQLRILQYYQALFREPLNRDAQLFFSTHSEHILKNALEDKMNNIVIVINDNAGVIETKKIDAPNVLPTITSAETNYIAFDLISTDYHIELYGWLQDKSSNGAIKACDDYIVAQPQFNSVNHSKPSTHPTQNTTYDSICTYIRNAIHHPDNGNTFTQTELRTSIELLIELCR